MKMNESEIDTLANQDVSNILESGRRHAESLGISVSIAVVDESGHLRGFLRMDGASFMTVDIAIGKAWTSAAFRASSQAIEESMAKAPAFASSVAETMGGRFMPRQGGVLIGTAPGAVGVSGGSADQDEEIATRAITAEV